MFEMLEQKVSKPRTWPKLVGIVIVAALIGCLILVPRLWPQSFTEMKKAARTIWVPMAPHDNPPVKHSAPPTSHTTVRNFVPPRSVPTTPVDFVPTIERNDDVCYDCVPFIVPGPIDVGHGTMQLIAAAPPPPPPNIRPPEVVKTIPKDPIRVGGVVQAANLVNKVLPVYPPMAKLARQQGTVRLAAIISKDGSIQKLELVSGPPLLVLAAMEAVKQWQYRPTLLNTEPVEVITTIDVVFTLAQ